MPYSSSLTAQEWEMLEPVLPTILPPKKQTRPSNRTNRELLDGIFYQLKNGCNWEDLPKDLPPYKGRILALQADVLVKERSTFLMDILHSKVREQVKKKAFRDDVAHNRLAGGEKHL